MMAGMIFLLTLFLVIFQPKGLGIGWSALGGAALALLSGIVSFQDVWTVWQIIWNATGAFIAIILISLILDEAGSFKWAALYVARWGRGNGRALFVLSVLLGAVVAALFANDGAALILTPIMMAMLLALGYEGKAVLAFVMAGGFIADMGSLPLVISNLVNIVSADFFHLSFKNYALVMLPVSGVSIAATLGVLFLFYRKDIPVFYPYEGLPLPASAIKDKSVFKAGWAVLLAIFIGCFFLEPYGIPVSLIAGLGACLLLFLSYWQGRADIGKIFFSAPWQVVLFSLGMYVVVYGLKNAGLTDILSAILEKSAAFGLWGSAFGSGLLAALLSSVMNNMPSVLLEALAIASSHVSAPAREAMIYGNIIGCDLGPKLTPIGSLATLLWLHVLKQKGVEIGWGYYCKIGMLMTLPILCATLAGLVLVLKA